MAAPPNVPLNAKQLAVNTDAASDDQVRVHALSVLHLVLFSVVLGLWLFLHTLLLVLFLLSALIILSAAKSFLFIFAFLLGYLFLPFLSLFVHCEATFTLRF